MKEKDIWHRDKRIYPILHWLQWIISGSLPISYPGRFAWTWEVQKDYLITWNFRDTFISRFWGSHISRHLNFAILRKFCILSHFNFAFLSETQFISLSILFNMSLNLIKLYQQCPNKQKRNSLCTWRGNGKQEWWRGPEHYHRIAQKDCCKSVHW